MRPTVGRIVHFYTTIIKKQWNGVEQGPYAAIITQVNADGSVNLDIFPVCHIMPRGLETGIEEGEKAGRVCWWVWPPKID